MFLGPVLGILYQVRDGQSSVSEARIGVIVHRLEVVQRDGPIRVTGVKHVVLKQSNMLYSSFDL